MILEKDCPDFGHFWVKFLIWNVAVRVSRNKNSEINLCSVFLWCVVDGRFIEMPLFQVTSAALKNPWLRPCIDATGVSRKNQNLVYRQEAVTWNLSNHSVKLAQIRIPYVSFVPHCGVKSQKKPKEQVPSTHSNIFKIFKLKFLRKIIFIKSH